MDPNLILIDGNNLFHRQYWAYHSLEAEKEGVVFKTGMLYGTIKNLLILKEWYPDAKIKYCFDTKYKNIRLKYCPSYKSNRKPKEEGFLEAFGTTISALGYLGYTIITAPCYEADDVIYTLHNIERQTRPDNKILVISNDHDMFQMLGRNVSILLSKPKGQYEIFTKKKFIKKFEIEPKQYAETLCLSGCPGDNAPGIPKLGEKTAMKLIKKYGSLKEIRKHSEKIGGKIGENIRANWEIVERNKKVVKLIEISQESLAIRKNKPDFASLKYLFEMIGFKQYLLPENWKKLKTMAGG